jgi:hypothetical protein
MQPKKIVIAKKIVKEEWSDFTRCYIDSGTTHAIYEILLQLKENNRFFSNVCIFREPIICFTCRHRHTKFGRMEFWISNDERRVIIRELNYWLQKGLTTIDSTPSALAFDGPERPKNYLSFESATGRE